MFKALIFLLISPLLFASPSSVESVLEMDGKSSHIDGPNCWNGALVAAGVLRDFRFMHPDEWLFVLNKNCHEVETPLSGDIGRLFLGDMEVHGFVHLDSETVFAKHGQATKDGYQIMSYEKMNNSYQRTRQCRMSNSFEESCFHELRYYRCNEKHLYSPLMNQLLEDLEEILFSKETKISFKDDCESQSFLKREELLSNMLSTLEKIKEKGITKEDQVMAESLSLQIYDIEVSNRRFRCKPRSKKYQTIRKVKKAVKQIFDN